ncbi:MAG: hypothetical protein RLZZ214_4339 [Verrucomicrobiota bacterium]
MTTARNYIILLGWLAVTLIELAFTKSPTTTP